MRLHEQRDAALERTAQTLLQIQSILEWLESDKFQWPDDWVRTWEVRERIMLMRDNLTTPLESFMDKESE